MANEITRLTHAQKDLIVTALAAHIPGTAVRRIYRDLAEELGADSLAVAHDLIAAANPKLAGPGRVCLTQSRRLAEVKARSLDRTAIPVT